MQKTILKILMLFHLLIEQGNSNLCYHESYEINWLVEVVFCGMIQRVYSTIQRYAKLCNAFYINGQLKINMMEMNKEKSIRCAYVYARR